MGHWSGGTGERGDIGVESHMLYDIIVLCIYSLAGTVL